MQKFAALLLLGFFGACSSLFSACSAQTIQRVIVFGDSYSDIGRGYLDGNGPTAVAYLATRLGSTMVPSNAKDITDKSLDFAVSGATTGDGKGFAAQQFLLGFGMKNQVREFAEMVQTKRLRFDPATTLFFLAGGLNDARMKTEDTVANLSDEVGTLHALGARRFRIALLPESIPGFHTTAARLNPALAALPAALKKMYPDATIEISAWGPDFDKVMAHPLQYGITNTTDRCAGREIRNEDTKPCAHPEAFFYYHAEHPSTAVQKAVGAMLYDELKRAGEAR